MVKTELLKCFIAAAETGSFSAAGRVIGKHLATVSGNIAKLEDELGIKLFDRDGKYPQLTEAGINLYDGAKVVVDGIERFGRNAEQLALGIPATFKIAIDEDLSLRPFLNTFKQLQAKWPHLKLHISTMPADQIFEEVREQRIDLAVTPTLEGNSQFYEFRAVGHSKVNIFCAKDHPLAKKRTITNDDLMAFPQVISTAIASNDAIGRGMKMSPTTIESNGYENLISLLTAGVGWGFINRLSTENISGLKILAPEFAKTQLSLQYDIIWPKNSATGEVREFLFEKIAKDF